MFDPPIFIVCRDRVTPLKKLVSWLEQAGHQRITLVDNDSDWQPLLDYLEASPHKVIRFKQNHGAHVVWEQGLTSTEHYVVTDPDCVPIDECPKDAVGYLKHLLDRWPNFQKVGLGLYTADVPEHCPYLGHERMLVRQELEPGIYESAIDTTFALYRPGAQFDTRALRTGFPFQVRHLSPSWYCDDSLTVEDWHYVSRSRTDSHGSTWARKTA